MLATLAMKRRWQNKRKAEGKDFSKPNIVMNSAVQVCWEKAARYFEIEEKYVFCTEDRYVIDPEEAVSLIDENTIGICTILGIVSILYIRALLMIVMKDQHTPANMKTLRL